MALDPVPWFVGGGAQHSPEVARLAGYAALGGAQGVIASGDLKVQALQTPGAAVRVGPGAVAILNRASGGSRQMYFGHNTADETVEIAATGSEGGRSDLIIARIEDPFMAGEPWEEPEDVTSGPYIFFRVIPDVPDDTTSLYLHDSGQSGIALARIDIPANTATITDEMITDVRFLARPRRERSVYTVNPSTSLSLTATDFASWPSVASWSVAVPSWATKAIVRGSISGVAVGEGQAFGQIRITLGSAATQATGYDESVPSGTTRDRKFWRVADTVTVPTAMRGTRQTLRLEGFRHSNSTATVAADDASSAEIDIEFMEAPR